MRQAALGRGQVLQPSSVAAHSREPAYQVRESLMVAQLWSVAAQARCTRSSMDIQSQAYRESGIQRWSGIRIESEVKIRINLRVPGYTAFLDDGTSIELEPKEHNIELNEVAGYSISNLLADLPTVTIWGSYQDPTFWYWDIEQKGLIYVTTDNELYLCLQKCQSQNLIAFVVEFVLKPAYKSSATLDAKLEMLPIRRKPNLAQESDAESSEDSGEENDRHEENVHPSWMDDEDIFMEDHYVFVSL